MRALIQGALLTIAVLTGAQMKPPAPHVQHAFHRVHDVHDIHGKNR